MNYFDLSLHKSVIVKILFLSISHELCLYLTFHLAGLVISVYTETLQTANIYLMSFTTNPQEKATEIIAKFSDLFRTNEEAKRSSLNMAEYMMALVPETSDIAPMTREFWKAVIAEITRMV